MAAHESEGVDIHSDEGAVVVSITSLNREGDQLRMEGKLMGAWNSVMYMNPEMVVKLIKLMLNRSVITFLISLPFILGRRRNVMQESGQSPVR